MGASLDYFFFIHLCGIHSAYFILQQYIKFYIGMVWDRFYHLCCNKDATFDASLVKKTTLIEGGYIRRIKPEHKELLQEFWGSQYCDSDWIFQPSSQQIDEWIADDNCRIWAYSQNDHCMATVMIRRLAQKPWPILSVDCIAVYRPERGKGLTAVMLDHLLFQATSIGWLQDKKPFTILGMRETPLPFSLGGFVPYLRADRYAWAAGNQRLEPIARGQKKLVLRLYTGAQVHIYNSWRQTFPGSIEQWEVCWAKGVVTLAEIKAVCPPNIHLWVSSAFVSMPNNDTETGWNFGGGYTIVECLGRPPAFDKLPYMHY